MPAQLSMMRIFSKGSLNQGGRLYSAIQNYKKETRKYLYFDKEPTIEIDYSSFHPHLIYHQAGLQFDGDDPYEIQGFERDHVKVAFNIMINRKGSKNNKSAAATISEELEVDLLQATALEDAILRLHAPIAGQFNSGAGLRLQRLDSGIEASIVDYFINVLQRPIVSIHDSFVVTVRDIESLILAMDGSYKELLDKDVLMRGVKSTSQVFSEPLTAAINMSFHQLAEEVTPGGWDTLVAKEGIYDPSSIEASEEDVSDA